MNLVGDLLALSETAQPRALNGADVNEHGLAAAVRLNEAETLCGVEPLNRCACRKLYPAIMMMKAAEDRLSSELAEPSDGPMARRIFVQE